MHVCVCVHICKHFWLRKPFKHIPLCSKVSFDSLMLTMHALLQHNEQKVSLKLFFLVPCLGNEMQFSLII